MYKNSRTKRKSGNQSFGRSFSNNRRNKPFKKFSNSNRGGGRKKRGDYIDISKFVKKSSDTIKPKPATINHSFADFKFCQKINDNLKRLKFITPTPIQDRAIPHVMNNQDVIGLANTGTGKTGVFLLPLLNKIFYDRSQKVLIIAPTRELALQIDNDSRQFAQGMNIFSSVIIGGAPISRQLHSLRRNPSFVIGTPGRLKDVLDRKALNLQLFNNVVLDEVDRMLDMGFIKPITELLAKTNKNKQVLFFSATLSDTIKRLAKQFLRQSVTIDIQSGQTADNVDQDIVRYKENSFKFEILKNVLTKPECKKVLVFSETKREVEKLTVELNRNQFKATSIHGNKRQSQREKSLTLFRNNKVSILVATDVAARGLDIKDITHVINYTIPQTYNDYIHRIGRTGRGDKKGRSLTFVR